MNTRFVARSAWLSGPLSLVLLAGGHAGAQQPTAAERAALEPAAAPATPTNAAPPAPGATPAAGAIAPAPTGGTTPAPTADSAGAKKAPRPATGGSRAAAQHSATASDRVDLDTTTVTGNQELPKVMYIVPWKKSEIGDLAGRPMNSLLDEVLAPVDRDVFRREVTYYDAVKAEASQPGVPPTGAPPGGSAKPE